MCDRRRPVALHAPRPRRAGSRVRSASRPNSRPRARTAGAHARVRGAAARCAPARRARYSPASTPGDAQQFGDDAFVDVGVLAQVERGEVEAEGVDRADQPGERSVGAQHVAAALGERMRERGEVVPQRRRDRDRASPSTRARARRGVADDRGIRGGEAGVDAGQRAAIGLVAACAAGIVRGVGERAQRLAGRRKLGRDRQFGAERVDLVEIMADHRLGRSRRARGAANPRRHWDCRRGRRRSSCRAAGRRACDGPAHDPSARKARAESAARCRADRRARCRSRRRHRAARGAARGSARAARSGGRSRPRPVRRRRSRQRPNPCIRISSAMRLR